MNEFKFVEQMKKMDADKVAKLINNMVDTAFLLENENLENKIAELKKEITRLCDGNKKLERQIREAEDILNTIHGCTSDNIAWKLIDKYKNKNS